MITYLKAMEGSLLKWLLLIMSLPLSASCLDLKSTEAIAGFKCEINGVSGLAEDMVEKKLYP